jgi:hypothetical protein
MGYFPPHMYDPQINIISKPFELNKERLRKDFMSPKYENRSKEFFAIFFEFLQTHIRKKYYDFMNDIQTEVNFFEWFDKYYKPKILADRNTKFLLQKEATHRTLITKDRPLTTNHALEIPNTRHIISNTRRLTTLTTNHAHEIPNTRPLNTNNANQMVADQSSIFSLWTKKKGGSTGRGL